MKEGIWFKSAVIDPTHSTIPIATSKRSRKILLRQSSFKFSVRIVCYTLGGAEATAPLVGSVYVTMKNKQKLSVNKVLYKKITDICI